MGRRDNDEGDNGGGTGGEISMSIEETNKLRISLGLKPLSAEPSKPKAPSAEETKRKEEESNEAKTEELADRIKAARERRTQQELLDKTKTLGEADPDVDDVMAWVNKTRVATEQQKKTKQPAKKQIQRKPMAAYSDEEDEEDGFGPAELAGMKVAHGVDDLDAGESLILTLEDRKILDDKGNLVEDEDAALENILVRETKKRAKAYEDSCKTAKPLWEEDGKRRGVLDKYDEEEEEILTLGDAGTLARAAMKSKKDNDISSKLAAGAAAMLAAEKPKAASDYYTQEEIEAMKKPKKKKERKLKKKTLTGEEMAALEADAAARGGDGNLGSRKDREARAAQKATEEEGKQAERRSRFDHALAKANYASLALKADADKEGGIGGDEEDDDLYRSLNKARQLANKASTSAPTRPDAIAESLIRRREEREKAGATATAPMFEGAALTMNDMEEFTRNISVKHEDKATGAGVNGIATTSSAQQQQQQQQGGTAQQQQQAGAAVKVDEEDYYHAADESMEDVNEMDAWAAADEAWQPANDADGGVVDEDMADAHNTRNNNNNQKKGGLSAIKEEETMTVERPIGRGIGAALDFLKDRGELKQKEMFAGRTNDTRNAYFTGAMGGFKDLYTGGSQEDKLALDVEIALTRRDEYGRILTPKEAFRQMCHKFHGIYPSRNTKEKRFKQVEKELAQSKVATGVSDSAKMVHEKSATPYVVLSGNVKPGQSRDANAGYATVDPSDPWDVDETVPKLGGSETPLTGRAKVEMMLGVKRPAGGTTSMAPPPAKAPKRS